MYNLRNSSKFNKSTPFIEKINQEIKKEIKKILAKDSELFKLGDIIKYHGIKNIAPGKIRFGKPRSLIDKKYHLWGVLEGILTLDDDYGNNFTKFYSKYNLKNPYRIEIDFENKRGSEGTLAYVFGNWIRSPFSSSKSFLSKGFTKHHTCPKYAIIALRPEKFIENKYIISQLTDELKYEPTHIQFGTDYKNCNYEMLIFSKYMPNGFEYQCNSKQDILQKWDYLIPGLKESFL